MIVEGMGRREVIGVVSLIALAFTGTMALRLMTPALSFYLREDLQATILGVSSLTIAYMLGRAISAYFSGTLVRGKRVKIVPPVALVGSLALVVLYPYATEWYVVSLIRGAQGALMGFTWPVIQFLVVTSVPSRFRGRAISTYFFIGSIAGPVSNAMYGAFFADAPIESVVVASAIFYVMSAVIAFIGAYLLQGQMTEDSRPESGARGKNTAPTAEERFTVLRRALLGLGFGTGGLYSVYGSSVTYVFMREAFGLGRDVVAYSLGLVDAVAMLVRFASGFISDRFGPTLVLKASSALILAGFAAIGARNYYLFMIGLSLLAMGRGSFTPVSRAYASFLPNPKDIIGKLNSLSNLGTVTAQLSIGVGYDVAASIIPSMTPFPVLLAGHALIAAACLTKLKKPE